MEKTKHIKDSDLNGDGPVVGHIRAEGHGSRRMWCRSG